jgi:hypothetical protein
MWALMVSPKAINTPYSLLHLFENPRPTNSHAMREGIGK